MASEHVLIWPSAYPLLLKGLAEQNGAFILDALESWPTCGTSVDDGVTSSVLPPLYYLIWLAPPEPYSGCELQHIDEFDQAQADYLHAVVAHFQGDAPNKERVSQIMMERIAPYCDVMAQANASLIPSFSELVYKERQFAVLHAFLEGGLRLSIADVFLLWQEVDFRSKLTPFIPSQLKDQKSLETALEEALCQGEDVYDLLQAVCPEGDFTQLLERALLTTIKKDNAKQSDCMRFIEQGAKGTAQDEYGNTAFFHTILKDFPLAFNALLPLQDKSAEDNHKHTALHIAVKSNNTAALRALLKAGFDPTAENYDGLSCYRFAVEQEQKTVRKVLEREFGIKELSHQQSVKLMWHTHGLFALAALFLPLQAMLFFQPELDYKAEAVIAITLVSMVVLFVANNLKRSPIYPDFHHPVSFWLIRLLGGVSLVLQLLLVLVVLLSFLS